MASVGSRRRVSSATLLYLGSLLVAGLVLGGGTVKGLPTTSLLQVLGLPLVVMAALAITAGRVRLPLALLVTLIGLIFVVQISPLRFLLGGTGQGVALSQDIGRTIDSLAFLVLPVSFFIVVVGLDEDERGRLLPFVFLGVLVNVTFALVQFAASHEVEPGLFPYDLGAGFFANANHFSALLYAAIPFVVYQAQAVRRLWAAFPFVALIVFVEFAAGSMAGIGISLVCSVIALAVLVPMPLWTRLAGLGVVAGGALWLAFNGTALDPTWSTGRLVFALNTASAIPEFLPFGSGIGTFPIVYPGFESTSEIENAFVNHAHNEYLELLLEGGVLSLLAMLAFVGLMVLDARRAAQSPFKLAALCAIVFLLVHSLVDYPLRTLAVALVFAYCTAVYFSRDDSLGEVESPSFRRALSVSG